MFTSIYKKMDVEKLFIPILLFVRIDNFIIPIDLMFVVISTFNKINLHLFNFSSPY